MADSADGDRSAGVAHPSSRPQSAARRRRERLDGRATSRWTVLLPEGRRYYLATVLAVLVLVPTRLPWIESPATAGTARLTNFERQLSIFVVLYAGLTLIALWRVPTGRLLSWARRTPGHRWWRALLGIQPGTGAAALLALSALLQAVVWLPKLADGQRSSLWLDRVPGLTIILGSWVVVLVTYAVDYLVRNERSGRVALRFPGREEPAWSDYLYFAASVSTTFGTTDVEVLDAHTRKVVALHSFVAFVFNTVILAAVVGLVA